MSSTDYSAGSRLLHRVALASNAVAQMSFDIESLLHRAVPASEGPHVFIAGLARAGTTVVLRALYQTGQFRSLTYRDMPFVLMPGLWSHLSRPFQKDDPESERAHGDRIVVNADSPEAFEEVFWRAHCGSSYIGKDRLTTHSVDEETLNLFRRYVDLILASDRDGRTHYLSKNNNNVLRLKVLRRAFNNAIVVIPFRDPNQQAMSLMAQHQRFCAIHETDRFSFRYMTWLGHHEFGKTHRPFAFPANGEESMGEYEADEINYWLKQWCNTYEYVLDTAPDDAVFVSYQDLCEDSHKQLQRILSTEGLAVGLDSIKYRFESAPQKEVSGIDEALSVKANEINRELNVRAHS